MSETNSSSAESVAPIPAPERIVRPGFLTLVDRTAVLVVGLCAGFAVGWSFVPATPTVPIVVNRSGPDDGERTAGGRETAAGHAVYVVDPRVLARVRRTGKLRVGVFGDSFGIGVWDAMYRLLPAREGFEILRFGQEATGFTRYRVSDVEARAREQLAAQPVDVAVISFGVNDAQPMYEGKLYPFMSDDWKRIVGGRVDRFVAVARSTGAPVIWIGLPAMRNPELDGEVQALNGFFAERVRRLGATFVETRPLSVDVQGRYASHLPDPASGVRRLIRTGDGVHMIGVGYQRIVGDAVARIRAYDRRVRDAAAAGTGADR